MILQDDAPLHRWPWATLGIIAACCGVFVWEISLVDAESELSRWWLVPERLLAVGRETHFLLPTLYLPFLTATFLHADALHLFLNMAFLGTFGDNIEDRLGHLHFAGFFASGGIAAATAHVVANPDSALPVVGASGAIASIMGCFFVLHPGARLSVVFLPVRIPALLFLALWFALQITHATAGLGKDAVAASAAWWAHSGGFVYGMAIGVWLRLGPVRRRRRKGQARARGPRRGIAARSPGRPRALGRAPRPPLH